MAAADTLIREIPLIRRRAHESEAEDHRFRAYLKQRLPLSNVDLDRVVQETTDVVWSQIDCLACGNCCRTLQIVVDDRDIRRLARRLGMTTRQFADKYVGVAEDATKHFLATPCAFLGDDNRCSVYADRPKACSDYPYLRDRNFRARTLTTIENTATCPIVFNVWESLKRRFARPGE